MRVEWDDAAVGEVFGDNQASYPLTKFTLILKGESGNWTSSSLPGKAKMSLGRFGSHEIQFTSGWGPENHTNGTIPGGSTYSINVVLSDPTNTALPDITSIPGPMDLSKWSPDSSKSHLKFYVTESARAIYGSVDGLGETSVPKRPEISIQHPKGKDLKDGRSALRFADAKAGTVGEVKTCTILNTGKAPLTNLSITKAGKHKGDFTVGKLTRSKIAPGAKATFPVTFKPSAAGTRQATIAILSNDEDENPFEISVRGTAR